jgi:hypothetical protein
MIGLQSDIYTVVPAGDKLRRRLSLAFVVAIPILSPYARAQQVIFDNATAPLTSYFFNDAVGLNPVTGQNVLIAFPFTVQGASYILDEVGLITSINGGAAAASGLNLFVYADAGGKPGVVLESWQGVPVTSTIALQTAMSVKHPVLQPGQYWFGVTATNPQQTAVWWVSPASAQSAICETLNGTPGDCFTVGAANGFEILGSRCQSASSCSETLTIYQTGFEPTTFGQGTINGQDSWFVNGQPGQSLVETAAVETGVQSVEITPLGAASGDVGPQRNTSYDATNQILTFGIDANLSISGSQSSWTVLHTQYNNPPSDIDFNIDPSGQIHIFSGSLDHTTGVMITRGVWNQYILEVNFIGHTIRAFYNGAIVLQGLSFPAVVTVLESYAFYAQGVEAGTDVGVFDNLSVTATPGQGLVTSQTGLTFRASPNGTPATQTVQVLSPNSSISWTVSVNTLSGGSWLAATPMGRWVGGGSCGRHPHAHVRSYSGLYHGEPLRPSGAGLLRLRHPYSSGRRVSLYRHHRRAKRRRGGNGRTGSGLTNWTCLSRHARGFATGAILHHLHRRLHSVGLHGDRCFQPHMV